MTSIFHLTLYYHTPTPALPYSFSLHDALPIFDVARLASVEQGQAHLEEGAAGIVHELGVTPAALVGIGGVEGVPQRLVLRRAMRSEGHTSELHSLPNILYPLPPHKHQYHLHYA